MELGIAKLAGRSKRRKQAARHSARHFDDQAADIDPDVDVDDNDTEELQADDSDTDNVGDPSVEINVQELIHQIELQGLAGEIDRVGLTRRRLEDLMEQRRDRLETEDFDDYDLSR